MGVEACPHAECAALVCWSCLAVIAATDAHQPDACEANRRGHDVERARCVHATGLELRECPRCGEWLQHGRVGCSTLRCLCGHSFRWCCGSAPGGAHAADCEAERDRLQLVRNCELEFRRRELASLQRASAWHS